MSLKEVKQKIKAVKKIAQVTKAMEAVSAVKMRRSQGTAIEARPYAMHALGLLQRLSARLELADHPLVKHREAEDNVLLILITSDRGLAGALNSYILRAATRLIAERNWSKDQVKILAIGKKGYEHFLRRGYTVIDHIEKWGEGVAMGDPEKLARQIIKDYHHGVYDRVMLVYSNFQSTFLQEPVVRRVLPLSFAAVDELIEGIVPERGKYSELREGAMEKVANEYVYEPDAEAVLFELFPYLIATMLYHAVLEANASEHSARMVAMKSASDRARDVTKELTLSYNKERQSSITAEISEITTGMEAMK
jgi:F-type H+-transporting ATPase subunit gamma